MKSGEPVAVSERQLDVLLRLVAQPGQIVAKDDLIAAAWQDVAVADNSLEQVISALRRILGTDPSGALFIETVPRRGYRFGAAVQRKAAANPTQDSTRCSRRTGRLSRAGRPLRRSKPDRSSARWRSSKAPSPPCRNTPSAHRRPGQRLPDAVRNDARRSGAGRRALARAVHHARDACRLDPASAEAWATLGFVLDRTGPSRRRARGGEPGGGARTRQLAASLPPGVRELGRSAPARGASHAGAPARVPARALAGGDRLRGPPGAGRGGARARRRPGPPIKQRLARARFGAVALHWLRGLVHLARGDDDRALAEFERELAGEGAGHMYSRECCANTWYAIGALRAPPGPRAGSGRRVRDRRWIGSPATRWRLPR